MEIPIRFLGRERAQFGGRQQGEVGGAQPSYFEGGREGGLGYGGKGQERTFKESGGYGQQAWQQPQGQQWQGEQRGGISGQQPSQFQQMQQPQQPIQYGKEQFQQQQPQYGRETQFQQQPGITGQQQQFPEKLPSLQKPGMMQQQPGMQQAGFQQQPLGAPSMIGGMAGLKECQIQGNWTASDITTLYMLTWLEGQCYIKNHLAMLLSGDKSGVIKNWHRNVTKKNLDSLISLMHSAGLSLPFPVKLEDRENELKRIFQQGGGQFSNALHEGECLLDIKFAACTLEQLYSHGFMSTCNPSFRNLCRDACGTLTGELLNLNEAFEKTPQHFPIPIVKTVLGKEGVWERR